MSSPVQQQLIRTRSLVSSPEADPLLRSYAIGYVAVFDETYRPHAAAARMLVAAARALREIVLVEQRVEGVRGVGASFLTLVGIGPQDVKRDARYPRSSGPKPRTRTHQACRASGRRVLRRVGGTAAREATPQVGDSVCPRG